MHEVAAIQGAVRAALQYMQQADASRVTHVQLSVAVSGHMSEDVIRQYFTLLSADTPAAGAALTIVWLPATYRCLTCLQTFQSLQPAVGAICPACGEVALEIDHRDICALSAIDVAYAETEEAASPERPTTTIFLGDEALPWQA